MARLFGESEGATGVEIIESGESGLALLELIVGFDLVVIVDALHSRTNPPGTVTVLGPDSFQKVVAPSAHFAGLPEILELGRRLELSMPASIHVVAVEVADPYSFNPSLTQAVAGAVPQAAEVVGSLLRG